jgi:hypothetical protein
MILGSREETGQVEREVARGGRSGIVRPVRGGHSRVGISREPSLILRRLLRRERLRQQRRPLLLSSLFPRRLER